VFTLQIDSKLAKFRVAWSPGLRQMQANILPVSRAKQLSRKKLPITWLSPDSS